MDSAAIRRVNLAGNLLRPLEGLVKLAAWAVRLLPHLYIADRRSVTSSMQLSGILLSCCACKKDFLPLLGQTDCLTDCTA